MKMNNFRYFIPLKFRKDNETVNLVWMSRTGALPYVPRPGEIIRFENKKYHLEPDVTIVRAINNDTEIQVLLNSNIFGSEEEIVEIYSKFGFWKTGDNLFSCHRT